MCESEFRNSKKLTNEKKNCIKKIFIFFRIFIFIIRSGKAAVFCDVIDATLIFFAIEKLFSFKVFFELFFKNKIVFDFLKFNEFDRIVDCFDFFEKNSSFDFERIKMLDRKRDESVFFTYCCKSLMSLNDATNPSREDEDLEKIFKIFEFSFFAYCSTFFVLIEVIIGTAEKIEKTNCKFCCFETALIAFFHRRFVADKKRASKDIDFFSKIMKRLTDWKIMFFFSSEVFFVKMWKSSTFKYVLKAKKSRNSSVFWNRIFVAFKISDSSTIHENE